MHLTGKRISIEQIDIQKNIYDIAGNLSEYVQEVAGSIGYTSFRGGNFYCERTNSPACFRTYVPIDYTDMPLGFRPVLYIK